jgi:uncharacterized membrane protein YccC
MDPSSALTRAYQALTAAVAAVGTSGFDAARNTAWAAVNQAHHALALARRVPRRDRTVAQRLCVLGQRAPRLLHAAELADLERTVPLPAGMLAHVGAIAAMVSPTTQARRDVRDGPTSLADAAPAEQALDREIQRALAAAADPARTESSAKAGRRPDQRSLPVLRGSQSAVALRLMLLTLASGATSIRIGLDRWYWTPVCAVATLWGSHTWRTWYRAAQRGLATVAGCFIGVGLLQTQLAFPAMAALVAVLFFLGELSFPRNYGIAMLFVTPMVLLTIQGASPVRLDGGDLGWDRIFTTLLGCAFGVAGVLVLLPSPSTRLLTSRIAHSLRLQRRLVAGAAARPSRADTEGLRAEVRADLVALDRLAADALGEVRLQHQARARWVVATSVQRLGYLSLTLLAVTPETRPDPDTADRWQEALEEAAATVESGRPANRSELPADWGHPALRQQLAALQALLTDELATAGRRGGIERARRRGRAHRAPSLKGHRTSTEKQNNHSPKG